MFQETGDQATFQARYVIRHPFRGSVSCEAGRNYLRELNRRRRQEAQTLASLTGWEMSRILSSMGPDAPAEQQEAWWKKLWK